MGGDQRGWKVNTEQSGVGGGGRRVIRSVKWKRSIMCAVKSRLERDEWYRVETDR